MTLVNSIDETNEMIRIFELADKHFGNLDWPAWDLNIAGFQWQNNKFTIQFTLTLPLSVSDVADFENELGLNGIEENTSHRKLYHYVWSCSK